MKFASIILVDYVLNLIYFLWENMGFQTYSKSEMNSE